MTKNCEISLFFKKYLVISKKSSTFALAFEKEVIGAVVQLVRIHACHAWGREFESRPHRKKQLNELLLFLFIPNTISSKRALHFVKYSAHIFLFNIL